MLCIAPHGLFCHSLAPRLLLRAGFSPGTAKRFAHQIGRENEHGDEQCQPHFPDAQANRSEQRAAKIHHENLNQDDGHHDEQKGHIPAQVGK